MRLLKKILAVLTVVFTLNSLLFYTPSMAITIAEEEELSREFMKVLFDRLNLVKDPYIVNYVNSIGQSIVKELSSQPFSYNFYVIDSDVYNAFATPAGHIFIYRGLIEAMETEDELAGILGHEIAHVQCRHISDKIDRSSKINLATLAGLAAGVFLGISGSETAAQAVTVGSMAAAQSLVLAYSREDEIQADKLGLENLNRAGYDGTALMTTLNKIRSKRWFDNIPNYLATHPAAEDRIAYIDSWSQNQRELPSKGATEGFKKMHTRLLALYGNQSKAMTSFKTAVKQNPDDALASYGYGLILARSGLRKDAAVHLQAALEQNPLDSSILGELGRIYFLDGRLSDALTILRSSIGLYEHDPETLFYLGRTQMELGRYVEAASSFSKLIANHSDYDQAYYFLGESYGKLGNLPDAHYYLGLYYEKKHDPRNTIFHLEKAFENTKDPDRKREIEDLLKKARKNLGDTRRNQSVRKR
jgi:beta-barrel assembly-enhancing protease